MKLRHNRVSSLVGLWLALAGAESTGLAGAASLPAQDAQAQVAQLEASAEQHKLAGELSRAETTLRSALEIGEAAWGDSLQVAGTLTRLGNLLRLRGRLEEAAQLQRRALGIRERLAPDSLEVADSLHHLFHIAVGLGDQDEMSDLSGRALPIVERFPPDTLAMADALSDLGLLETECGRHAEAVSVLERALAILERRVPGSIEVATSLGRLGLAARQLGDAERAEEVLQRALAIRERLAPNSVGTAAVLNNLGALARDRGDLRAAEELFRRGLAVWEKAAPEGSGVAGGLNSLGIIARLQGDLDKAWALHRRVLEISERLPHRFDEALALACLGMVAEARGDLALAIEYQQRAHALYQRWVPSAVELALTLQQLGRLHRRTGHPDQAARYFAQAVDTLEAQVGRLGGSQDFQAAFRARYEDIYHDAIEVELERGNAAEAFHLAERSRARSFLALLSERDLAFSGDVPPSLERARRDNAARYDRTLRDLARWTPEAGEEKKKAVEGELSRLRRERDEIADEIREASPRLAALRQPSPLDLAAARQVLDPGTLALSYSVGKDRTALLAVTREGGLRVEILPAGEAALRRDVESLLKRIEAQETPTDLARSLYRTLIAPVAGLAEHSQRVLIVPDGPLHRLPFGALIRDTGQYLTEWKPLHAALSLTVYGTLREPPRPATDPAGARMAAFGDPRYPGKPAREPAPGVLALRNFNWEPLPYSRREVERIAEVYPGARVYLGERATEEEVKSVARDAGVLHFATHGYVDDRTPLDSALVLTIPEEFPAGRDNGLLQVWEIFESVRLDADLVVLSSCESALGRELSGEGMIGLTRAFQYAGARSVVASLWSVADQVTAELMARFHRHRADGLPKDEALRAAQIELIREPVQIAANGQTQEIDASSPFFWAAFQLFGDWR